MSLNRLRTLTLKGQPNDISFDVNIHLVEKPFDKSHSNIPIFSIVRFREQKEMHFNQINRVASYKISSGRP